MNRKLLCAVLAVAVLLLLPGAAGAVGVEDYGLYLEENKFEGTFENWENMMFGRAPAAFDPELDEAGVLYLIRTWNDLFEDAAFFGGKWKVKAYCNNYFFIKFAVDEELYTWHWFFKTAYFPTNIGSRYFAIPMDMEGKVFTYVIENEIWVTDADGEVVDLDPDLEVLLGEDLAREVQSYYVPDNNPLARGVYKKTPGKGKNK